KAFTNTNPGPVHGATLIAAVCPNARFLLVKRNLEDNILRIFMKRYRQRNPHSYDLKAAKDYVVWYYQMVDLLAQKLPDVARVLNYEDMIANPGGALRSIAEWLRLPMPEGPLPVLGDDRGCARRYREFIAVALEA